MSDRLRVDYAALETLTSNIAGLRDDLSQTRVHLQQGRDDVGSPGLRQALQSFEDHWARGRDLIARTAEDLAFALSGAVDTYSMAEAVVTAAARRPQTVQGGF